MEKARADVGLVFVRDDECEIASFHLRVFSTGVWPFEAQLAQSLDKLLPRDGGSLGIGDEANAVQVQGAYLGYVET